MWFAGAMKIKKLKYFEKKPHEPELNFIPVFYPGQIRISTCWFFVEGGKQKKPVKYPQNRVTTTSTHIRTQARIEHGPHPREASTPMTMNLLLVTR